MPKKRKVVEVKVEILDDYETKQIKTECDSQVSGTPENDGNPYSRNLRPRKNKCYAEKESPEIEEPRVSKVPRRRRRTVVPSSTSESVPASEPDADKDKEQQKEEDEETQPPKVPEKEKPKVKPVVDQMQARPDHNKNILDAVNLPFRDIRLELENFQFPIPSAGPTLALASKLFSRSKDSRNAAEIKPKSARKRPKKTVLGQKIKTEPLDTPPTNNIDDCPDSNLAIGTVNASSTDKNYPAPTGTRSKRKRKKPQPTTSSDNQADPTVMVKVEVEIKVDPDEEQVYENVIEDESSKKMHPTAAIKKAASRSKPKGKIEPSSVGASTLDVVSETEKESDGANQEQRPAISNTTCKRPKTRSKPPIPPNTATTSAATTTTTSANVVDELCKVEDDIGEDADDVYIPSRRSFPRGRKSKLLSSRIGRKEVMHTDEAIDPADICGFEHVERYVPPAGVRLPKFWDSEDEVSDDENSDNFRRIMCGFGTNCRIHEVIRPASEIVRRLKELQNTFGGTRTLPLFHHGSNEPSDANIADENVGDDDGGKKMPILWHNDPAFFKYANNFPSCSS